MHFTISNNQADRLSRDMIFSLMDIGANKTNQVANEVEKQLKENHGTTMGNMFHDITENTKKRKGSSAPLVDTGQMRDSIHVSKRASRSSPNAVVTTKSNIAKHHEFGFIHNRSGKFIKPRPVWFLTTISRRLKKSIDKILNG